MSTATRARGAVNGAGPSSYAGPICTTTPAEGNYALDCGSGQAYVTFGQAPQLGLTQFTLEPGFGGMAPGRLRPAGDGGVTNAIPMGDKRSWRGRQSD